MKKLLMLYVLLTTVTLQSQNYTFNLVTKYNVITEQFNTEVMTYTNTDNDSYYLRIRKSDNELSAALYDFENVKRHDFNIKSNIVNGEIMFDFEFLKTSNIMNFHKKNYSKYVYDFTTVSKNDSLEQISLKIYPNAKKKKPLDTFKFEVQELSENLFPAFRINCLHPYEFLTALNRFKNGIVVRGSGINPKGNPIHYELKEWKLVQFYLLVPKSKG